MPHELPEPVELRPGVTIRSTVTAELYRALLAALRPPERCQRCGLPMVATPTGRRCPIDRLP